MSRPVLFLDIDGVLVTHASLKSAKQRRARDGGGLEVQLDAGLVCELNRVTMETGARLVLSSTWREIPKWRDMFAAAGIVGPFIGATPATKRRYDGSGLFIGTTRGMEIRSWLAEHPTERYAIVDDDADMLPEQLPFFVQTTFADGLTREAADRLIDLLMSRAVPA